MKKKIILLLSILLLSIGIYFILKNTIFKNPNFIELSYEEINQKIDNHDTFALCVSATKCIHCKSYKPKLNKITKEYNIVIYYTNIDKYTDKEYEKFKKDYSFDGATPTTIFFKEGQEKTTANRIEGDVSEEKIITKLKQNGLIK